LARTLKKHVLCLADTKVTYTEVGGYPIFHCPKGRLLDSDHAADQLVDRSCGPVSHAIPLCLPVGFNPLVHLVDEEASPALLELSLLEEDLLGNGMGLRHNPFLYCFL
jgi:hypothetical protein